MSWLVFDSEALKRGLVDACHSAGIDRATRSYLWSAMRESLITPDPRPDSTPERAEHKRGSNGKAK